MPKVYRIKLNDAQTAELKKAVRTHPKPYVRERATGKEVTPLHKPR